MLNVEKLDIKLQRVVVEVESSLYKNDKEMKVMSIVDKAKASECEILHIYCNEKLG